MVMFLNSFFEVSITLTKLDNDITKKENCGTIFLMSLDEKFSTEYSKLDPTISKKNNDKVGFISVMQSLFKI